MITKKKTAHVTSNIPQALRHSNNLAQQKYTQKKKFNKTTLKAIQDTQNRHGLVETESMEDFFKKLGI